MFRFFFACILLVLAACAPSPQTVSAPVSVPTAPDIQTAVNATLTAVAKSASVPTIVPPTVRPTNPPVPSTPTPGLCKFREICTSGLVSLAVVGKESMSTINQVFKSQQGRFLVLDVALENDGPSVPYNMLYFRLRDKGGREYNPTIAPEPSFKHGDLGKGEIVRGFIAFDVPPSASGFILTYAPLTFPAPASIRVDLGE